MTHGMVSAPQPEAVEAGAEMLAAGGNAVDAAIATALVQTAVDPQMCGIAGFGSLQVLMPEKSIHTCIDFHGRCPLAATEDMWADLLEAETEDGFGFILKGGVNDIGYGAITTPGSLKAYSEALARFGTKSLGDVLQPAIRYCTDGFMVRPHVSYFWNLVEAAGRVPHAERLKATEATRRIYLKADGAQYRPGEVLRNPEMGRTYERVAEGGADVFYSGAIADEIDADMQAHGGLLSKADLEAYATEENEPLRGTYRGHEIATNQPPGGGVMILEMLNILENFDLAGMGHNSADYVATVSEAMKIATVDKDTRVGDPRFVDIPMAELTSKEYAKEMAARIGRGEKTHVPRLQKGADQKDTTHISVVDEHGTCVAMTHSLGMPSGVVTAGLGFMYNGCMCVFDPRPGRPGSIRPGKARFTAMCPTIVFKDGKPFLVIGAPGGTYITMGVLQGILNAIDFGMTAAEAVAAPRFCTTSDTIDITNRITRRTQAELEKMGYAVRRSPMSYHFAGVHAIRLTDSGWDGGADPGRDGMALAV